MKKLNEMTCREYSITMHPEWGEFRDSGKPAVIYLHPGSRIHIQREQHTQPGFGLDRMEAIDESYNEHGKSSMQRDAEEFASDFVEHFCDHLSIRQLDVLIPVLIAYRDSQEKRRQEAIFLANSKFSAQ